MSILARKIKRYVAAVLLCISFAALPIAWWVNQYSEIAPNGCYDPREGKFGFLYNECLKPSSLDYWLYNVGMLVLTVFFVSLIGFIIFRVIRR